MINKMMKMIGAVLVMVLIGASAISVSAGETARTKRDVKKPRVAVKPPKTVKVTVNRAGFNPSAINVEKGYPLTLVFYRATREGCGTEVMFPALNIRRNLPLKRNVTVKFTPKETGEISFSCGMNMMKGKIVAN
jgi:plastocyanin domain-containing protein